MEAVVNGGLSLTQDRKNKNKEKNTRGKKSTGGQFLSVEPYSHLLEWHRAN